MAKKKRRVSKASPQPTRVTPPAAEAEASPTNSRDVEARLRSDYAYVVKDLRIIFTVAAAMFVLLIVLNLLI
jgi:hypothetical protein